MALEWLFSQRDDRGLNFIAEGDWCDPMNMVGYKGKGVSTWLTLAAAYACKTWAEICLTHAREEQHLQFSKMADELNSAVNQHLWKDEWYARGITDAGRVFGTAKDDEGKIFLNPQSWAILSGAADQDRCNGLIKCVEQELEGPFGVEMLAPAFTKMHEDIGRVTQKFPGSAENGSVYNHAAAFYIYALYQCEQGDRAFRGLKAMIPGSDNKDLCSRGQLPVFIPNYYRGANRQFPRTAGRSSQLFNTGSVHWFYRSLIEGLFGIKGCPEGVEISPQIPSDWPSALIVRKFRGATLQIEYVRAQVLSPRIKVNGKHTNSNIIKGLREGMR